MPLRPTRSVRVTSTSSGASSKNVMRIVCGASTRSARSFSNSAISSATGRLRIISRDCFARDASAGGSVVDFAATVKTRFGMPLSIDGCPVMSAVRAVLAHAANAISTEQKKILIEENCIDCL